MTNAEAVADASTGKKALSRVRTATPMAHALPTGDAMTGLPPGIPSRLIEAALADPSNAHAAPALERALSASKPSEPVGVRRTESVAQKGTSGAGDGLTSLTVVLPLPPKGLHPNHRMHWRQKARVAANYRAIARIKSNTALTMANADAPWWERATAQTTFYFRINRHRDEDGALSSLKAAFDGIADARVVVDDRGLTHLPVVMLVDAARPRVEITLTRIDP